MFMMYTIEAPLFTLIVVSKVFYGFGPARSQ
jgi:hypothetical protein